MQIPEALIAQIDRTDMDEPAFKAAILRLLLAERRKQAKLTQTQLADRLGWDQSTISMIESGQRKVDVVEFMMLAQALGFDPAEMMKTIADASMK
jgi:transcriptional regulator with XRE-family HTH domain